jgi:hypothetical protein
VVFVRGPRRVSQSPTRSRVRAVGSSQPTSTPFCASTIRRIPGALPEPGPAWSGTSPEIIVPPPGPKTRPRPLSPSASSRALSVRDPPMYGRLPGGESSTTANHQPTAGTMATPAASSCHTRRRNPVGAATR